MRAIYLDYNATAPMRPEVREKMLSLMDGPFNASSAHAFGRRARAVLEDARAQVAAAVGAFVQEVVFCGSGTEANAMALSGFSTRRVAASAVEHSSVLKYADHRLDVDTRGVLRLDALAAWLAQSEQPALVSVMLANNETGVIQPVAEAAALCKAHGALLHCDAVQGLGKIPVDFGLLGADLLTISTHKCGGPLGAAALVVKSGVEIAPLLRGGGQELNRRAGTENLPAIAGFGAAAEQAQDLRHMRQVAAWRDALEARIAERAPQAVIFGQETERLPNTLCVALPGISSEVQLMKLDLAGVAISAGSACSSGRIEPSHVLLAMGVERELAACAIRISAGWASEEGDFARFAQNWLAHVAG